METYLILPLFVYGLHKIFYMLAEALHVDLDRFYYFGFKKPKCVVDEYEPSFRHLLLKPLFYCNVCMSSFWGTLCFFTLLGGVEWRVWILHCVVCAAVISLLNQIR